MIKFLISFALWMAVFLPSSIVASLAYQHKKNAGVVMQLSLLVLSFALALYLRTLVITPLKIEIVLFGLLGFTYSLILNVITRKPEIPAELIPRGLIRQVLLFLFLAPLSEELLNRGLAEGYLLKNGYHGSAIVFSAVLFAIPHMMAFKRGKVAIVTGSFVLGLIAGYAYYTTGIAGAFFAHSCANLAGLVKFLKSKSNSGPQRD